MRGHGNKMGSDAVGDIKLMSAYADEGTLSTQGFPVDLVLRITHTPI